MVNGANALLIIFFIFVQIPVSVSSATRSALVETGEQRSPKYTPERIAPPVIHEGIPSAVSIPISINVSRIFFTFQAPCNAILLICRQLYPCFFPYRLKMIRPARRAYNIDFPVMMHIMSKAQKIPIVRTSMIVFLSYLMRCHNNMDERNCKILYLP